jgi:hypothetical protein
MPNPGKAWQPLRQTPSWLHLLLGIVLSLLRSRPLGGYWGPLEGRQGSFRMKAVSAWSKAKH